MMKCSKPNEQRLLKKPDDDAYFPDDQGSAFPPLFSVVLKSFRFHLHRQKKEERRDGSPGPGLLNYTPFFELERHKMGKGKRERERGTQHS